MIFVEISGNLRPPPSSNVFTVREYVQSSLRGNSPRGLMRNATRTQIPTINRTMKNPGIRIFGQILSRTFTDGSAGGRFRFKEEESAAKARPAPSTQTFDPTFWCRIFRPISRKAKRLFSDSYDRWVVRSVEFTRSLQQLYDRPSRG